MDKRSAVMQLMKEYRQAQANGNRRGYSYGRMAGDLSQNGYSIRRQTLWFWEAGKELPRMETLMLMLRAFPGLGDWRHEFALDLMAASLPEVYQPVGEIGRRVLARTAPQS